MLNIPPTIAGIDEYFQNSTNFEAPVFQHAPAEVLW